MSLILDALRKADRERQQQQNGVPGIDAAHSPAEAPPRKLWPWIVAIALLLLGLLAAVIWLALERNQANPAAVPAKVVSPQATKTTTATPNTQRPNKTSAGDASPDALADNPEAMATANNKAVQSQSAVSSSASASSVLSADEAEAGPAPEDTPPIDDEVAQLYRAPPPDEPPVTVATRQQVTPVKTSAIAPEVAKPAATAAPVRATLLAGHPSVGTIRDLPLSVQNEIPTLMYAAHEFRPGGSSEVMINNQALREGQKLGDLELEVITEDGVIMRTDDHRFKLTALSSWVNM